MPTNKRPITGRKRTLDEKAITINVNLINIRGMRKKLPIMGATIRNMHKSTKPHILCTTESGESPDEDNDFHLQGYVWLGKPRARQGGGIGAWIHVTLSRRTMVHEPTKGHEAIMWLKVLDNTKASLPTYIVIVYSRPNCITEHVNILNTLTANMAELHNTSSSRVIIAGDFNSKLTHLFKQTIPKHAPYKPNTYEHAFWKFIQDNKLTVARNKQQIKDNLASLHI